MRILEGIVGLLASRKATLCLLILITTTAGLILGKLDGTSYSAVMATISSIYMFVQHRVDLATVNNQTAIINNTTASLVPVVNSTDTGATMGAGHVE